MSTETTVVANLSHTCMHGLIWTACAFCCPRAPAPPQHGCICPPGANFACQNRQCYTSQTTAPDVDSDAGPSLAPIDWSTRRLWSLWDMINFSLHSFVHAHATLRQEIAVALHRAREKGMETPISDDDRERLTTNLRFVSDVCRRMLLQRADDRLDRIFTTMRSGPVSYVVAASELDVLREAIEDDVQYERFYHYPHPKGLMVIRVQGDWAATIAAFPMAGPEIEDAIDCYAAEHGTAAIFHLMRVAEYGLRALARERGVRFPTKPVEWATWQDLLTQIGKSVTAQWWNAPAGPQKDAALAFYSGALAHFHGFKDQYRNAVMHVRQRYDEHQALRAIHQVRDFMNGLSAKIGERTRRPISRWP